MPAASSSSRNGVVEIEDRHGWSPASRPAFPVGRVLTKAGRRSIAFTIEAFEHRLALFEEGVDALHMVLGQVGGGLGGGAHVHQGVVGGRSGPGAAAFLARRSACGGWAAVRSASADRLVQRGLGGHGAADQAPGQPPSPASMTSPVKESISAAQLGMPVVRSRSHAPPSPGIEPSLRKVTPNRALSAAMRMSVMQATSQPRPMAAPFTAAMAGNLQPVDGADDAVDVAAIAVADGDAIAGEGPSRAFIALTCAAGERGAPSGRSGPRSGRHRRH